MKNCEQHRNIRLIVSSVIGRTKHINHKRLKRCNTAATVKQTVPILRNFSKWGQWDKTKHHAYKLL